MDIVDLFKMISQQLVSEMPILQDRVNLLFH